MQQDLPIQVLPKAYQLAEEIRLLDHLVINKTEYILLVYIT